MPAHIAFIEMSATGAGERCIEYALSRGYRVTLVTSAHSTGTELHPALNVVQCDTRDRRDLLECVRRLDHRCPVDGVTTTHDLFVPHAALAAEVLQLPGLSVDAASRARNKYSMRLTLARKYPDLTPEFCLVDTYEEALGFAEEWGYPLVAKPQDANDSIDVVKICDEQQLKHYMTRSSSVVAGFATSPGVLLEQYIEGSEHSVETRQHPDGEVELLAVTDKVLVGAGDRHFAEAGICLPVQGAKRDLAFHAVSRALACLEINCGVIHTEVRIQDGAIKILEVNPRMAGDMTGSHMLELAFGVSVAAQVVELALGNDIPWRPTKSRAVGKFAIEVPESGYFGGIANLDAMRALSGVAIVRLASEVGRWCDTPPRSNLDFVARVVTTGDTTREALDLAKQAAACAEVQMMTT